MPKPKKPATTSYEIVRDLGGRQYLAALFNCSREAIDKWHQLGIPTKHFGLIISKLGLSFEAINAVNEAVKAKTQKHPYKVG
jgi:hypothetical protein